MSTGDLTISLSDDEQDLSLRLIATSNVIRDMWKQLMHNLTNNVTLLAGLLHSKGQITLSEDNHIISRTGSLDKTAELILTVERKGWLCLVQFVKGLKMLSPLHDLKRRIELTMEKYSNLYFQFKITVFL